MSDGNFDSSCHTIRIGAARIQATKITPPEDGKKRDKGTYVGEEAPAWETPGVAEVSDGTLAITEKDWLEVFLPACPKEIGGARFIVTDNASHSTVSDSTCSSLWDGCRVLKIKLPEKEQGNEKGLMVELTIGAMSVHHRGADGVWKTLHRRKGAKPLSRAAQRLML